MAIIKYILKEMRIKHYIKNIIIFIPLFFNRSLLNREMFIYTLIGMLGFSLVCSGVYILNDIIDLENDKAHPLKKNRPLAAGKIPLKLAYSLMFLCFAFPCLLTIILNFNPACIFWMVGYVVLNFIYSSFLKQIPIVDILILSGFYLIRLYYGASICDIEVSNWLFLTIMFGSLMLGSGKRYKEKTNFTNGNLSMTREVLRLYTAEFLHDCIMLSSFLTIMFYSLWTLTGVFNGSMSSRVIYTIPLLAVFILSYIYELSRESDEDVVVLLLKMPTTPIIVAAITAIFILELYGKGLLLPCI